MPSLTTKLNSNIFYTSEDDSLLKYISTVNIDYLTVPTTRESLKDGRFKQV